MFFLNALCSHFTAASTGEHTSSHHWEVAAGLLLQDLYDSCSKKSGYCTSFVAGIFKNVSMTYPFSGANNVS